MSLTLHRKEPSTGDKDEPRIQPTQTTNNFDWNLFFYGENVIQFKRMVGEYEFETF